MVKRSVMMLGLAALCCGAPTVAQAGWEFRLYQPHLYPAPPYHFPHLTHYPSAYYYPPFYNARIGYTPETYRERRTRTVRKVRSAGR